jgi:hypothetical protein
MFKWLKRQFVPHEINGFRPLFLRRESAVRLAGALIVIELVFFVLPTLYFPQYARDLHLGSVLPGVLATLTNEERSKYNLPTLTVNSQLSQAAQLKADDMASKGYFSHNSPDGKTPWYWFEAVGYKYNYAGENLAVNFSDSEEVTQAWMNSPSHQANLVGRNYSEMGTGIASGIYKGNETIFVVQLYGAPKLVVAAAGPKPVAGVPVVSKPAPQPAAKPAPVVPKQVTPAPQPQPAPDTVNVATAPVAERVLGESIPENAPLKAPSIFNRLMSSPRQATNAVLYLALAVVIVALFMNMAVKFEYQFPDLVANGAVVALLIIGIQFGNNLISKNSLQVSFMDSGSAGEEISLR